MGRNMFMSLVRTACSNEGICGEGSNFWVTTHGLRGTLATILFENGHSDSSVAMRTGHRDPKSLKSYQHLRGSTGLQQQRALAPSSTSCVGPPLVPQCSGDNTLHPLEPSPKRSKAEDKQPSTGSASNSALFSDIRDMSGNTINITINYGDSQTGPKK